MSQRKTLAESMRTVMDMISPLDEDVPGINLKPEEPSPDTHYGVDMTVDIENIHHLPPSRAVLRAFETWLDKVMMDVGMQPTHAGLRTVGFLFYTSRRRGKDYRAIAARCIEMAETMRELLEEYRERTAPDLELRLTVSMGATNLRQGWWTQVHEPEIQKLATGQLTMGQMLLTLDDEGLIHRGVR